MSKRTRTQRHEDQVMSQEAMDGVGLRQPAHTGNGQIDGAVHVQPTTPVMDTALQRTPHQQVVPSAPIPQGTTRGTVVQPQSPVPLQLQSQTTVLPTQPHLGGMRLPLQRVDATETLDTEAAEKEQLTVQLDASLLGILKGEEPAADEAPEMEAETGDSDVAVQEESEAGAASASYAVLKDDVIQRLTEAEAKPDAEVSPDVMDTVEAKSAEEPAQEQEDEETAIQPMSAEEISVQLEGGLTVDDIDKIVVAESDMKQDEESSGTMQATETDNPVTEIVNLAEENNIPVEVS